MTKNDQKWSFLAIFGHFPVLCTGGPFLILILLGKNGHFLDFGHFWPFLAISHISLIKMTKNDQKWPFFGHFLALMRGERPKSPLLRLKSPLLRLKKAQK